MKGVFPEYYIPSEAEFDALWREAYFVFDTNVLFNLYRYSQKVSEKILGLMSSKDIAPRVWIPHQFAYEYQKGRLERIAEQRESYSNIVNDIDNICKQYGRHPFVDMGDLMKPVREGIASAWGAHPDWETSDPIRDRLTELFDGKVGSAFTEEKKKEVYAEGEKRYAEHIPPGYKDRKKQGNDKYGDLIGWMQIIEFAKSTKKPVIFITDETHDDWWQIARSGTVGPRPELIKEMEVKAGIRFHAYSSSSFVKYAAEYLEVVVSPETIQEIKEVSFQVAVPASSVAGGDTLSSGGAVTGESGGGSSSVSGSTSG